MSVVLSGPRRVYVLLLFCQRVGWEAVGARLLSPVERAPDVPSGRGATPVSALCRPVMALRLRRVLWSRLVGFSVLVFDARA